MKTYPGKVLAVKEWPIPSSCKQLQRFLGFTNFNHHFIQNYKQVAVPLTTLTSTKRHSHWTPEPESAFNMFTSAPVLVYPDTTKPFIVEADVPDVGVGAVLSQYSGPRAELQPCALFSRRLSAAENNYDVGDRGLIAIKLA